MALGMCEVEVREGKDEAADHARPVGRRETIGEQEGSQATDDEGEDHYQVVRLLEGHDPE